MAEQFGPYRLDELIGRGGMGEVHRAFDTVKQRTVALKRLPVALADDPEFQARFRSESALAAQLSEPHIIPIHDYGEINGQLYIDMRLVDGRDLAGDIAERGPMDPRRAVHIVAQIAGALDAAHDATLIHRDVKPSNVIVRGVGVDEFAYLIDFGIARTAAAATSGPALTAAGATIGTLDYMAPERFDSRPIDGRADVYSLACMLFELLTGSAPFHGRAPAALIHAHLALDPPRPSQHRLGLPAELDEVVVQGMAKNPDHRFATAGALAAAARAALVARVTRPTVAAMTPATWRQTSPPPTPPAPLAWLAPSNQVTYIPPGLHAFAAPPGTQPPVAPVATFPKIMILSAVLQILLGSLAFLGSVLTLFLEPLLELPELGILGAVMSASLVYLACVVLALKGRHWARVILTVINSGLAVSLLIAALADAPADPGEWLVFLIMLGYPIAATLPMFTPQANRYFAARRPRPAATPHSFG